MNIQGKIILDIPLQEGISKAGNPWKKKEWVLETIGTNYPRKVKFDFFGDRVDSNHLEVGKVYDITYEIESREFNGRWYTDIRALSAVEIGGAMAGGWQQPQQQFASQQPQQPFASQQPQQPFAPQQAQEPFGGNAGFNAAPASSQDDGDLPF